MVPGTTSRIVFSHFFLLNKIKRFLTTKVIGSHFGQYHWRPSILAVEVSKNQGEDPI